MDEEHQKEMSYIRQNKQVLQKELRRMVLLMQQELLPRERQLHEMLENLNVAYRNANEHLKSSVLEVNRPVSSMTNMADVMVTPMRDAEQELKTIGQLLTRPISVPQRAQDSSPRHERRPTATFGVQPPSATLFDVMDRNHDGVVTAGEFQQALQSRTVRDSVFDGLDRNHDGYISRQEMNQAMGGSSPAAQMTGVGAPRPVYGAAGRSQEDWVGRR